MIIARSGRETCHIPCMENYLKWTSTSLQEQRFVFCLICKSQTGECLRESISISYMNTCLWEHFKRKVVNLSYNPTKFGLHSLQNGEAIMVATAGVPDKLIKHHRQWKSENAYFNDSDSL